MLVPDELNVDWMEPLAEAEDRLRHAVVMRAQVVRNTPLFRFRPNPVQWEFIRHEKNKLLAIMGANKVGKALEISEPVLTPTGWAEIGELKPGDRVVAGDGSVCQVVQTTHFGEKELCYRVTFDDGANVVASGDHLWTVLTPAARFKKKTARYGCWSVMTTEEILERWGPRPKAGARVAVPIVGSVDYDFKELPLDPYVLGCLLGDGSLSSGNMALTCFDEDVVDRVRRQLPKGCFMQMKRKGTYRINGYTPGHNPVVTSLRKLGLLGRRSWEKSVPEIYLRASSADRLALLQGLMDTDGTVGAKGLCSFTSTSRRLAEAVRELVWSLGGKATIHERKTKGRRAWVSQVRLPRLPIFHLPRKRERVSRATRTENRILHRIESVGKKAVCCISTDHPSQTFVTRDFIVTHNSTIVSVEGISRALGFRPYLPMDDPHFFVHQPNGHRIRVPNKGQVAAEDFPNGIRKIQWPMWHAWLPKNQYRIANTERGTPRELWIDVSALPWADRTSPLYPWSRVYFYAYAQGRESFAGFDPDWILNDEPPPKDVWIEQMRGLVSTGGGWMGAMTLVEIHQAWIFDVFSPREKMPWEGVDDDVDRLSEGLTSHVVNGKTRDNLRRPDGSGALTEKDVQDFEAMLSPEERAVRIEGQRIHMVGTEWGRYWDESIHVVPHRAPDPTNPQIMAVDPHPTKPYGILWAEVNEDDEIYVWAECYDWRLDTLEAIADHIKVIEEWKAIEARRRPGEEKKPPVGYRENTSGLQPVIRLIDPFSKVRERGAGASAAEQLGQLGLHFLPWKRANKSVRVRNVRQFLQKGWGPEGRPRLTISDTCKELIYEIPRYREKLPHDPETQERKGEMMKVQDDLVDALIAICNSGYLYKTLVGMKNRSKSISEFRARPVYDDTRVTEAVGGW